MPELSLEQLHELARCRKDATKDRNGACSPAITTGLCKRLIQVWVASAGGTGTNLVRNWLERVGLSTGTPSTTWGEWLVHTMSPSLDDQRYVLPATRTERADAARVCRAIFIYDEPCTQALSLFTKPHAAASFGPDFVGKSLAKRLHMNMTAWYGKPGATYPQEVLNIAHSYREYVERAADSMHLEAQWQSWTHAGAASRFPILSIHYDALWRRIGDVAGFLGLCAGSACEATTSSPVNATSLDATTPWGFPPRRARKNVSAEDQALLAQCQKSHTHAQLRREISRTPELLIAWRGRRFKSFEAFASHETPTD